MAPDGNQVVSAAARALAGMVVPQELLIGQWRARRNFSEVADKLRHGRYDAEGVFFWMEWLRVYRQEHKWYTQEIVRLP